MKNKSLEKFGNVLGVLSVIIIIIAGVLAIIMGIGLLDEIYGYARGRAITFGADFYTEIYRVTEDVYYEVKSLNYNVLEGLGWLLIVFGLTDISLSLYKLMGVLKGINTKELTVENNTASGETASEIMNGIDSNKTEISDEENASEWKCPKCGDIHQNYVGTCGCGENKPLS